MSNITLVDEKVDYLSYQSQEVCKMSLPTKHMN